MTEQARISATFEGEPIEAEAGASVAAALISSDRLAWRTTREGAKRGLFCGIGVCFDCLVEIDGESGQRACMIPLREGMRVCDNGAGKTAGAETDAASQTTAGGSTPGDPTPTNSTEETAQ